jgi:mRNA-degrading endonuclease toxin of MazEF toxin-antitoxin module
MYKIKLNKIFRLIENIKDDKLLPIIYDILDWFYQKIDISLNKNSKNKFPNPWEIWTVKLWMNIWSEQNWEKSSNYTRPALIIRNFWSKNDNIVILPMTKNKKPDFMSYKLSNTDYKYLKYNNNYLLLDQIRTISKKRLIWNPLWKVSSNDLKEIKDKTKDLIFS